MKKSFLFTALFVMCASVAVSVCYSDPVDNVSAIGLANIEALSRGEGTGNTGPGQIYDCPGWLTGDGKYCLCENQYECTETSC